MKCQECGGRQFRRQLVTVQTKVGACLVADSNAPAYVCLKCGGFELDYEVLGQVELRAALIALVEGAHFDGPMLRFARKALGLKQRELAEKLGRRPETLCRDEKAKSLDLELRHAMAGLVAAKLRPDGVTLQKVG